MWEVIERQLKDTKVCEYALYVKAMIKRQQGEVADSLQLFQAATCLNPTIAGKTSCTFVVFIGQA